MALKRPHRPADAPDVTRWRDDRGDIVLGWLTRLVATLAVLGLIGFDAISVVVGRLQAEDKAQAAARAAVSAWSSSKDVQAAYDAAVVALDGSVEASIDPASFSVAQDGAVTLTVRQTAATMLVEKVGPLEQYATSSATTTARPAA